MREKERKRIEMDKSWAFSGKKHDLTENVWN